MKPLKKHKDKKGKNKKKSVIKPKKGQVLVVAQEIKFARLLSGNEKKTRDRVLKALKKWLSNCFEKSHVFKEDDFIRVWKGLFYAMWMSDKPLVQEELCESIAGVLDLFPAEQVKYAVLMMKAGFRVLATEWYGIDYHRMDKFLMLVRRYLRGSLRCLQRSNWSIESCEMFSKMLNGPDGILAVRTPHYARNATSMLMHIADCFLEECSKVSDGDISEASIVVLIRPFAEYMAFGETIAVNASCRRVFNALVRQSELGLQYQQATEAWKQMGCPQGGPEALELASDDDDDETLSGDEIESDDGASDRPLDPRAGRVNVELASLPVPAREIAAMLKSLLAKASSKTHKRIKICMQRFERLSCDEYPLPEKAPPSLDEPPLRPTVAAKELLRHEKKLVESADELGLKGLSRKQRRRLLARSRAGFSIVDGQLTTENATNDGWTVESTEQQPNQDSSDKENVVKNKTKKRKMNNENNKKDVKKRKNDVKKQKISNSEQNNGSFNGNEYINDNKIKVKENKVRDNNSDSNLKMNKSVTNSVPFKKNKSLNEKKIIDKELDSNKKQSVKREISNNKKEISNNKQNLNEVKRNKTDNSNIKNENKLKVESKVEAKKPTLVVNKVKNFQKQTSPNDKRIENVLKKVSYHTPKKVKFVLKNNSMQGTMDYYKSVRQSPNIPFDGTRRPTKTNLKPSMPSPINPFFKKKLKLRKSM
ncbi:ribosomal RNA processing protein 1 homolog [Achroia grisella]|uniref:ribosomal RNA processing protein 1 homolog n=1 Tax=Achroia grisella TaxID=688607 RepID=UPI0027D2BFAD|nr:ribosomal RNA processing protein 1 homolog [Achroia grisella]